jgi:hypothetical protein
VATYIVNRNAQSPAGEHEVHRLDTCMRLPDPDNRAPLGEYASCAPAIVKATTIYPNSDGCWYCCAECHKK